jgi:predicted regulator of Ras-like GTPase activity (Roadblock/LC7/MglB family)
VERALARLCQDAPEVQWAALVTTTGLVVSLFPASTDLDDDRIAAMCAAALSLGERITKELRHGILHFAVLAGSNGTNLVTALNQDYCLSVSLQAEVSVHQAFEKLRPSSMALHALLGVREVPWLEQQ